MTSSASLAVHDIAAKFLSAVPGPVEPPDPVEEPDVLDFLETVPSFHSGEPIAALVPRTSATYDVNVAKYVRMLTLVVSMCAAATVTVHELQCAAYEVDPTFLRFIYELFDVYANYPFKNLIYRIWSTVTAITRSPVPSFQRKFLDELPVEIIGMIASFAPDPDRISLSYACAEFRRILGSRNHNEAHFALKYDNRVLHGPSVINEDALHIDVIDSMAAARDRLLEVASAFLQTPDAVRGARSITFDNEWGRMWPQFMPAGRVIPRSWSVEIFEPLVASVSNVMSSTRASHVRFVSWVFSRRLTDIIAGHPSIVGLTIESFGPAYPIPSYFNQGMVRLANIVYLALGLDLELGVHRRNWSVLSLCPNVVQLHGYVDHGSRIGYLFPFFQSASQHLHLLELVHFQGCTGRIDVLIGWLAGAAQNARAPSNLQRLKLHAVEPISHEEVFWLVSVLGHHYPNLRALIIEGVDRVPPYLFRHIQASIKQLETLSVFRRASQSQLEDKLCQWDADCFEYAEALRNCSTLQHLEVNMYWSADVWSPRAMDDLLAVQEGRCIREDLRVYVDETGASPCTGAQCLSEHPAEGQLANLHDGSSIAIPFIAYLTGLRTFAIRATETYYSCVIERHGPSRRPVIVDAHSDPHHAFPDINPFDGETWSNPLIA